MDRITLLPAKECNLAGVITVLGMHESIVEIVVAVVSLLLIASLAAIILRWLRLPYTVGLVAVGVGLALVAESYPVLSIFRQIELSPEIVLFVFLPTLIFESAVNLDARLLSKNLVPVLALAAPGLLISTAIVGLLVAWLTPLDLGPAFLFGALISATDPVAVVALFKELGAPRRLAVLVEGESLFNDATAIVLFQIIVAVLAGGALSAGVVADGARSFVTVFVGGSAVGAVIGYLMIRSIVLAAGEPLIKVALSTVVAYAAFIAADHYLRVSGVMATLGAGVVVGTLGATRFGPEVRTYLHHFWEYAAFVANSFIFLLVGLSLQPALVWRYWQPIAWAIVAVVVARALVIFGLIPVVSRIPGADLVDWRYQAVLWWGGLRGAVALALALSLPADFPFRELINSLAFGVVIFSILGGGITMKPLMSFLGLDRPTLLEQLAKAQAQVAAKTEAFSRMQRLTQAGHFSRRRSRLLRDEYRQKLDVASAELEKLRANSDPEEVKRALWSEAIFVERSAYRNLFDGGLISEPVLHELGLAVDLAQDELKAGGIPQRIPSVMPLEVRVPELLFGFLRRFWPHSRLVERHRLRTLSAKYEHLAAEVEASRRVVQSLDDLSRVNKSVLPQLEEIADFYRQREEQAFVQLDSFGALFPEYVQAVQSRTSHRVALDGEADAIEALASEGQIPPSVAESARKAVEEAQLLLRRTAIQVGEPDPQELLKEVPLFHDLGPADLDLVKAKLAPQTALTGEVLVKQGDRGGSLYLIARGVVAVLRSENQQPPRRIASLYKGDFFGEIALLERGTRTATVQAVSDCQLYRLTRKNFDEIYRAHPAFREVLEEAVRKRRAELRGDA